MCRLGFDKWLVCPVHSMYKDVRSEERVGDGFSKELDIVMGSLGLCPERASFYHVLEAPSMGFNTGCPWQLLLADD